MGQGFIPGTASMTPASRVALARGTRTRSSGRRPRRAAKQARRASPRRARRAGRMKFGSPAWQKKYRVGAFAKKRRRR